MSYNTRFPKPRALRLSRLLFAAGILLVLLIAGGAAARYAYLDGLKPVNSTSEAVQSVTIPSGATLDEITNQLKQAGLIRSTWAFKLYVGRQDARNSLQAGTYSFSPSQSVAEIVVQLSHGKVKTDLVTIIPGQRLDQVRATLRNYGFSEADINEALDPSTYAGNPALADKPAGASLEGYIYPDSYQKDGSTTAKHVVQSALAEMNKNLTPDLRAAFAAQGLSAYDAIILASIVEKEVSNAADRPIVAQVFLKRISIGMQLGSDVTAFYGARIAGQESSVVYDSPYNTRIHGGLPPTPISNVTNGSLQAVAHPASTDWLYFVSGDDGTTYFARTLQQHESNVEKYCTKLCGR